MRALFMVLFTSRDLRLNPSATCFFSCRAFQLVRLSDYNNCNATGSYVASKRVMDADRLEYATEAGYQTAVTKLWPIEATPKNDMLIGCPSDCSLIATLVHEASSSAGLGPKPSTHAI